MRNPFQFSKSLPYDQITRFVAAWSPDLRARNGTPGMVEVTASKPTTFAETIGYFATSEPLEEKTIKHQGKDIRVLTAEQGRKFGVHRPSDRILLLADVETVKRRLTGGTNETTLFDKAWEQQANNAHFATAMSATAIDTILTGSAPSLVITHTRTELKKYVHSARLRLELTAEITVDANIRCHTKAGAEEIASLCKDLITIANGGIAALKDADSPEESPKVEQAFFRLGGELLDNAVVTASGVQVSVTTKAAYSKRLGDLAINEAWRASEAEKHRTQSSNNLKRIGLAMHSYHDANKRLPASSQQHESGQVHSWRVALLPYLGDEAKQLYDEYRFDEPWDSVANKKLIEKMPELYRSPLVKMPAGVTSYFVLVGDDTAFPAGKKGIRFANITDGLSNTLMALESQRTEPWTKPTDIAYDREKPLPDLTSRHDNLFPALFCDGAVHWISHRKAGGGIDKDSLDSLIRRNDGNVFNV